MIATISFSNIVEIAFVSGFVGFVLGVYTLHKLTASPKKVAP